MEFGICLAVLFAARKLLSPLAVGVLVGVLVAQFFAFKSYAHDLVDYHFNVTQPIEYRSARWIANHLPGKRIMAAGDIGFWFNVFADNPQFGGGHDPFSRNWTEENASYSIYS